MDIASSTSFSKRKVDLMHVVPFSRSIHYFAQNNLEVYTQHALQRSPRSYLRVVRVLPGGAQLGGKYVEPGTAHQAAVREPE